MRSDGRGPKPRDYVIEEYTTTVCPHCFSERTEWQETFQFGVHHRLGSHQFKIGSNFARSTYDGRVELLPVSLFGTASIPIERIGFGPASRFNLGQNEMAWFVADKWTPFQRLTVDLGLRSDWDSVTGSTHAAPRPSSNRNKRRLRSSICSSRKPGVDSGQRTVHLGCSTRLRSRARYQASTPNSVAMVPTFQCST